MSRTVAVVWHALFSIAAGVLFFFFVLPRWPELAGDITHTSGTVWRIVAGALIGLAALPVVFTWQRTRRPEYGTPQLALSLRVWSIVLHVLGGALIVGTAISENWFSLDDAGRWLFGIYGAAAAICVLGIFSFELAFVAELPPPPPKPAKTKRPKRQRRRRKGQAEDTDKADVETPDDEADEADEADESADAEQHETVDLKKAGQNADTTTVSAEEATDGDTVVDTVQAAAAEPIEEAPVEDPAEDRVTPARGRRILRNRRPSGKSGTSRGRGKSDGSVAVDD